MIAIVAHFFFTTPLLFVAPLYLICNIPQEKGDDSLHRLLLLCNTPQKNTTAIVVFFFFLKHKKEGCKLSSPSSLQQ